MTLIFYCYWGNMGLEHILNRVRTESWPWRRKFLTPPPPTPLEPTNFPFNHEYSAPPPSYPLPALNPSKWHHHRALLIWQTILQTYSWLQGFHQSLHSLDEICSIAFHKLKFHECSLPGSPNSDAIASDALCLWWSSSNGSADEFTPITSSHIM